MQNLKEVRKAFDTFRKSDSKQESCGITPDLLFDDSMISGVLEQLLATMRVDVTTMAAFGDASNQPQTDFLNDEQRVKLEREEYNLQHASCHLTPDQKVELMAKRACQSFKQEQHSQSANYTLMMKQKFLLILAIFSISSKQQQASLSKDFFKQLEGHLKSCKEVESRVQLGLDFACQFQLSALELLPTDEAKNKVLLRMYELLRQAEDGALFGHDKLSFILDQNLNQVSSYLQELIRRAPCCRETCLRVLMQMGRVRSNPIDYLACIVARSEGNGAPVDLSKDMAHISRDLCFQTEDQKEAPQKDSALKSFTESFSLNRGVLYYYKAGQHKQDITPVEQLATDGKVIYHLKRGRGLFKLGVGDGSTKISGKVKLVNSSPEVKGLEPCAMFYLDGRLYVRDYCSSPTPFVVFNSETLQIDQELSEKWKQHFTQVAAQIASIQPIPDATEVPIHRTLLWHKDSRSGRTLEIAPVFTDGELIYCISTQKQVVAEKPPMLVLETYDKNLEFVRQKVLMSKDESFVYDSNGTQFLKTAQFMTNGSTLVVNVPNVHIYFFDMASGLCIGQNKSEHILMCYSNLTHSIYTIRSQGNNQLLYEVAFDNFLSAKSKELKVVETFKQAQETYLKSMLDTAALNSQEPAKTPSLMEQIVFGARATMDAKLEPISPAQESAQHTLLLRYLDIKREQAEAKLPTCDFINVFKYPNVTYLTGATFSVLITAASLLSSAPYELLYVLRLLQCNFNALIKCQGSLPSIMQQYQAQYNSFFGLYSDVLVKKVYQAPQAAVEEQIQHVCIDIMASSINILYKSQQEIVNKFLEELRQNPDSINTRIFFDYFSLAENCQKLLDKSIEGTREIFIETCKIQQNYTKRQILQKSPSSETEYAASKFLKLHAQNVLVVYCSQLQIVADRPEIQQKLPQHLVEKYKQEDDQLTRLATEVTFIFEQLSINLNECLSAIVVTQIAAVQDLIQHKSPFAQLLLCLYCTMLTAVELEMPMLTVVINQSIRLIKTIQQLYSKITISTTLAASQEQYQWLGSFQRTLTYLVSFKAYQLIRLNKNSMQDSIEKQLLQTSMLSGGIDEQFESEFSQVTRAKAAEYEKIWRQSGSQATESTHYNLLRQLIRVECREPEVTKALNLLYERLQKQDRIVSMTARVEGLALSEPAFASILKLQDQVPLLQALIEDGEDMERTDYDRLYALYLVANKSMRTWTHSHKNKLSERINDEVDQRHRKQKQEKIDQNKIVTIETQSNFFTDDEKALIESEQGTLYQVEIEKAWEQVRVKADYLIKLQPPHQTTQRTKSTYGGQHADQLESWRQMQKEQGSFKTISTRQQELMKSNQCEVLSLLQTSTVEVARIIKQVEDVYVAAHRRAAGLHIAAQVIGMQMDPWSRQSFIDSVGWFCCALRDNTNGMAHYQDTLVGCGHQLEEFLRTTFFKILDLIVKQLANPANIEAEINFFISALKWRFSGRDHHLLSSINLFQTLYRSKQLYMHWGKPVKADFDKETIKSTFQFSLNPAVDNKKEIQKLFDRCDDNKDGKLNYQECKDFYITLSDQYGQPLDQINAHFDDQWNNLQQDNKVSFEVLYPQLQLKVTKSEIAAKVLSMLEQLFASTVTRLIESDLGKSVSVSSMMLSRAKSIINHNSSELLLGEIFQVIFAEFARYERILRIKPGVDWQIYAQSRSKMDSLLHLSVDEYSLLDEEPAQPGTQESREQVVEPPVDESEESRKARLHQADLKKLEERAKQEIGTVTRLYSEDFLARLVNLIEMFTSVSAIEPNLIAMAQKIANPQQLSALFSLLMLASPRIKQSVARILASLVQLKLPFELYEEAVNLQLNDSQSIISQLFKKLQPTFRFKKSKFLQFLYLYALSIRQKIWQKSALESQGSYEVSYELLKLIRQIYQSQESEKHPWRTEVNEVLSQLFLDLKRCNRPREVEVLLTLISGADFFGIAPCSVVESGKDTLQVVGFASHDWLKRQPSMKFKIEQAMCREDLAVLVVDQSRDAVNALKLVPPSKLKTKTEISRTQYRLSAENLRTLLANLDLQEQVITDVQQLTNKCMVLKMINSQLQHQPQQFLKALKESGSFELLLKFVCKQSALEIEGNIQPVEWLEQSCYNIRKLACEEQKSLLKVQETQIKLVGDKLYASINSSNEFTRAKLLMAFNHKAFTQRKEMRLVDAQDVVLASDSEDVKVEHQVAMVDPTEFDDGCGLKVLNHSLAVVTYDLDLYKLVERVRGGKLVDDFDQKTIFVVSRSDFELLQSVGSSGEKVKTDKLSLDADFSDSLVKFGGFNQLLAKKTKPIVGIDAKTKFLFDLLQKVKDGTVQLKEEEQVHVNTDDISSGIPAEEQRDNQLALQDNLRQINSNRSEEEQNSSQGQIEGRFWSDTMVSQDCGDLADLYESKIKRLFNIYCRQIFWSIVQKDSTMFRFLLETEGDMRAFVSFVKVVGNECFVTGNKDAIKSFKSFVRQVCKQAVKDDKFAGLLKMIFNDVIEAYRKHLTALVEASTGIATYFKTESKASKLMNPYILLALIKNTLLFNGFPLIQDMIADLVSMLLIVSAVFFEDYQLKDKYWQLITKILDHSQDIERASQEKLCRLPLLKYLFQDLEHQQSDEAQEILYVQSQMYRQNKDFDSQNTFKQLFEQKRQIKQKYLKFEQKKTFMQVQLEVAYKFYLLARKIGTDFFFMNSLTSYLQLNSQLIQEACDGPISRHLLFVNQLTTDQMIIKKELTMQGTSAQLEVTKSEAEKMFIQVKPSSQLKLWHRVVVSTDPECKQRLADFSSKDIELGYGLCELYTDRAFVTIQQPKQNFTVDLTSATLTVMPLETRLSEQILQKVGNKIETTHGIYQTRDERNFSRPNYHPLKDHLKFRQVNFTKDCTIALLPNNQVIGFGHSKHRHFFDKPSYDSNKDTDSIPLIVAPGQQPLTAEEKEAQRDILMIKTFKRTTVCVTRAGAVYACGDTFAKNIKMAANLPFGFYSLPVDLTGKSDQKKKDESAAKAEEKKAVQQQEPEEVSIADLFVDDAEPMKEVQESIVNVAQPEQIALEQALPDEQIVAQQAHQQIDEPIQQLEVVQPEQQPAVEEQKQLAHSEPLNNLAEAAQENKIDLDEVKVENLHKPSDSEDEYIPKPAEEADEQQPVGVIEPQKVLVAKAEQVWISRTQSSRFMVVLALFRRDDGFVQLMTIGNSGFGLLGQGKEVRQSLEMRAIDFGFQLRQVDQVECGFNHFIVRTEGKVFAWGCYNTDSEEHMLWSPTELPFFTQYKIKAIRSGNQQTVALVEQIGAPDYFICGKFAPLSTENQYKSLKEFNTTVIQSFLVDDQQLVVSVQAAPSVDMTDVSVEVTQVDDYSFRPNTKLYDANKEAYTKFEQTLTLPESVQPKRADLIKLMYDYIFQRVKDSGTQFEDVQWSEVALDELKVSQEWALTDEQKRQWLLLVVNYCRHLWGHLTFVGGSIKHGQGMQILQNFVENRKNLPMCLKNKLMKRIVTTLQKDEARDHISIHIARLKAKEFKAEGKTDSKFEWSVFAKVSDALKKANFKGMRQNSQQSRAWFVRFIGESSNDDGGLFRESITELCIELQSQTLDLLVPCGNQVNKLGDNRDCWMINPKAKSKLHMRKFHFIGALFGMCVRSGILMNLKLAPICWKRLTGDKVTVSDLATIDQNFTGNLDLYRRFRDEGKPEQEFIDAFALKMQCMNSGGDPVDLCENGASTVVNYANLDEYVRGCISVRLTEAKEQYKALVKGFDEIFRSSYLKMISWQDLELKIVGNEEIDIERLKEMTQYKNCTANHDVVKRFWKVLASFENEDRKLYLRFVWGRMRLPLRDETDVEQHTVQLDESKKKTDLPFGRTCYFRIELPAYQSEEVMRKSLLYVIHNCASIDGDHNNAGLDEESQPALNNNAGGDQGEDSQDSEAEELRADRERLVRAQEEAARRAHQQDYGGESEEQYEE